MSRIFEMKLRPDPFNRICSGEKTIEYRLHDEKRSLLNKGDYIRFTEMHYKVPESARHSYAEVVLASVPTRQY